MHRQQHLQISYRSVERPPQNLTKYFRIIFKTFAVYWPILFKLNYVVRTAIANNGCKFHEDRLKDGVIIYIIVATPRSSGEIGHIYCNRCTLQCAVMQRT